MTSEPLESSLAVIPNNESESPAEQNAEDKKCGIVMPISSIEGCSEKHWSDVKDILCAAIEKCGLKPSLVSDAEEVGIIHTRIVSNLYSAPIVVCDVSAKNPNVMFELGLRLAFDKPTVIVKDDKTDYSFDASPVEHIGYRRDLRFQDVVTFQSKLQSKIEATMRAAESNEKYSPFLRHFGPLEAASLGSIGKLSKEDLILQELTDVRRMLARNTRTERRDIDEDTLRHAGRNLLREHAEKTVGTLSTEQVESKLSDLTRRVLELEDWSNYFSSEREFRYECRKALRKSSMPF
jgi:hypothetical protein